MLESDSHWRSVASCKRSHSDHLPALDPEHDPGNVRDAELVVVALTEPGLTRGVGVVERDELPTTSSSMKTSAPSLVVWDGKTIGSCRYIEYRDDACRCYLGRVCVADKKAAPLAQIGANDEVPQGLDDRCAEHQAPLAHGGH